MGLPQDQDLVLLVLEALEKQRLIKSTSVDCVSRRDAIKRLRAVGVAAAMIPIVATIAAPPPAAAASRSAVPPSTGTSDFWGDTWRDRSANPPSTGGTGWWGDRSRDENGEEDRRKPETRPDRLGPGR